MENNKLLELKIQLLEGDNVKDNKIYTVGETAIKLGISKRAVQKRCKKDFIKKTRNKYLITDEVILNWENGIVNGQQYNSVDNDIKTKTYLMKDKHNGLYKIGKSVNPKVRERTLQSEKPSIEMVRVWNYDIEKKLHNLYNEFRVRGEYFRLEPIQVKYICTHF